MTGVASGCLISNNRAESSQERLPSTRRRNRRYYGSRGLDPEHALVRWGNFDRTVLLPATVFEADESGRSYRFRPNMRSIWVRNFPVKGPMKAYFQAPDTPELADVVNGTGTQIVPGSTQTTNSWGLRGPEPNLTTTYRGIVLGTRTCRACSSPTTRHRPNVSSAISRTGWMPRWRSSIRATLATHPNNTITRWSSMPSVSHRSLW